MSREKNDTSDEQSEQGRANTSRRRVLQGVAAGSIAGIGGVAAGQDGDETTTGQETTTQEGDGDGQFFQEGTEIGLQQIATGMTAPTDFAQPEGDDRYFVSDQTGEVWVVTSDGRRDDPFIDVSDQMVELGEFAGTYASQGQDYDERGLLGIAFHPDFQNNRRFYLHYSAPRTDDMPENWDHREIVSEFEASEDLSSGDPDSEQVLLDIPHPQYNHDAGPMAFGPDGYLYVPMGDGGGANDDMYGHVDDWYDDNGGGNGQDVTENLLGSVLRIDVDGGAQTTQQDGETTTQNGGGETTAQQDGDRPYGIPDDNPFAGDDTEGLPEQYAWGFRNPFGIDFDSDGRLFTADLGQNLFEEVDVVVRGGNYGWNVREGTHCFSAANPTDPPETCPTGTPEDVRGGEQFVEPIAEYPHTYQDNVVGIAIIGGHFYEQSTVSGLQGKYIFGDWTQDPARAEPAGRLFAAAPQEGAGVTETLTEGEGTATEEPAETETDTETPAGKTATEEPAGPQAGPDDQIVPRDTLWEMEELNPQGEFDWFVRQFGQNAEGEIFVLVGKEGVPSGNSGTVLKIVPPGEGDGGQTATETDDEQTTEAEDGETTTETGAGETTTEAEDGETTTENGA